MFDTERSTRHFFPDDLTQRYSFMSFRGAAAVLAANCPDEHAKLLRTLRAFRLRTIDICKPGGSRSEPTALFGKIARRYGFSDEVSLEAEFFWKLKRGGEEVLSWKNDSYLFGHKIDHWSNAVALDYEWNSKDQTYDRDLLAFRQFFDLGIISCGIIVTRDLSKETTNRLPSLEVLDPSKTYDPEQLATRQHWRGTDFVQKRGKDGQLMFLKSKMGASTTGLDKLASRLTAGRGGACPILVVGLTDRCLI